MNYGFVKCFCMLGLGSALMGLLPKAAFKIFSYKKTGSADNLLLENQKHARL